MSWPLSLQCGVHVAWVQACGLTKDALQVVNKYLLADGACPKSYGPTVARAAGVPVSVTRRAATISEEFERGSLPAEQQITASYQLEGFKEVWLACTDPSPPDVASLQQLQRRIANIVK